MDGTGDRELQTFVLSSTGSDSPFPHQTNCSVCMQCNMAVST